MESRLMMILCLRIPDRPCFSGILKLRIIVRRDSMARTWRQSYGVSLWVYSLICCTGHRHSLYYRADSRCAPSQWETALLCNDVSHWLGASLESALYSHIIIGHVIRRPHCTVHPMNYVPCSCFVVSCCGKAWFDLSFRLQGSFTDTGAILWLLQCKWSSPEEYGSINHRNPLELIT